VGYFSGDKVIGGIKLIAHNHQPPRLTRQPKYVLRNVVVRSRKVADDALKQMNIRFLMAFFNHLI
jgi:hypothetical protein